MLSVNGQPFIAYRTAAGCALSKIQYIYLMPLTNAKFLMRWVISILVLYGVSFHARAADPDSLLNLLSSAQSDSSRLKVLQNLTETYLFRVPDSARIFARRSLSLARRAGYKGYEIDAASQLGISFAVKNQNDSALYYFRLQYALARQADDPERLGRSANHLGTAFISAEQLDSAAFYLLFALERFEQSKNYQGMITCRNNLGLVMENQGRLEQAYEYYRVAFELRKVHGPEARLMFSYSRLGNIHLRKKAFDEAEKDYQACYDLAVKYNQPLEEATALSNLGNVSKEKGLFTPAFNYYTRALERYQAFGQPYFEAFVHNNLGEILNSAGRFSEAADHAAAGLETAMKADNLEQQARANEILAEALFSLRNYEGARKAFQATLTLRDSLIRKEKAGEFARLEARYQNQEQEALLARQDLELEKAAYFRRVMVIGGLAGFFLVAILFLFWRQRQKIKEKEVEMAYQLERTEKESLKELDRLKSNFFANISHEFRTPLTLLISPLQEIREGTFKGSLPKYARIMERNARRLLQLVNQLLDLSRLESGKMELDLQPGDLMQALRAIAGSFESLALIRQISFLVEIPRQPVFVRFDRDKLEKILANLLSNAFKFTREEGHVSFTAVYAEDRLELEVRDDGIGIAEEHLPRLFERFFRRNNPAESDKDGQEGSGIGLALTKELVELHKGSIEAESEPGKGTAFRVVLPFLRLSPGNLAGEDGPLTHLNPPEPVKFRPEPEKTADQEPVILIAEDNEDIRLYIRDRLSAKYRVLEAADGAEGLKIALREVPDLIISDVIMPGMDGLEFCKAIKTREQTSHIPVILLTAKADHQDKLEGLNTGADDYLIKPFDGQELETRMINLLNQRALLRRRYSQMVFQLKPSDIRLPSADEQFLQRTTRVIEENIDDEEFGVEELAREIGMSRHHLHRKLKALIGQTPVIFIRTIRLERAMQLLQQQVGNASEVAFMVGFSSPAYFSKCFAEHFGYSPSKVNTSGLPAESQDD